MDEEEYAPGELIESEACLSTDDHRSEDTGNRGKATGLDLILSPAINAGTSGRGVVLEESEDDVGSASAEVTACDVGSASAEVTACDVGSASAEVTTCDVGSAPAELTTCGGYVERLCLAK
jgi:hypothetical protein